MSESLNNTDIATLAEGALVLSHYRQFRPAAHLAAEIVRRLGKNGEAGEDVELTAELAPFLGWEDGYLPGFIQEKAAKLVNAALERCAREGAAPPPLPDRGPSAEVWARLEKTLGQPILNLRRGAPDLSLSPRDFRDLARLRTRIEHWAPGFEDRLRAAGYRVWLDSISRVNPTSGYIWVAFRPDPALKKVEQPTFSLLFTCRHLRAGLEMGGRTSTRRELYFRKLLEGELDRPLGELAENEGVFADIAWYFAVRAVFPIRDFLVVPSVREIIREKARKGLEKLKEGNLYSWNLALPCRIFEAERFTESNSEMETSLTRLAGPVLGLCRELNR
ncbi:MAG TPA: hypothetical protein PLI51_10395 [bacterium]|nr:hypothetical protein [bacterium]HPQ67124.1 hypothetical protein [bacterium]